MKFTTLIALVGVASAIRISEEPTCAKGPDGQACRSKKWALEAKDAAVAACTIDDKKVAAGDAAATAVGSIKNKEKALTAGADAGAAACPAPKKDTKVEEKTKDTKVEEKKDTKVEEKKETKVDGTSGSGTDSGSSGSSGSGSGTSGTGTGTGTSGTGTGTGTSGTGTGTGTSGAGTGTGTSGAGTGAGTEGTGAGALVQGTPLEDAKTAMDTAATGETTAKTALDTANTNQTAACKGDLKTSDACKTATTEQGTKDTEH